TFWYCELLIFTIFQSQNDSLWWGDMEYFARYGFDLGNGLRCCCSCDGALKLHSRRQVMNTQLFTIDRDASAFSNVRDMPYLAVFHLDKQIVARDAYHFSSLNSDFF